MRDFTQHQIIVNKKDILDFISSQVWDGKWPEISEIQDKQNWDIRGIRWDDCGDEIIIDVC